MTDRPVLLVLDTATRTPTLALAERERGDTSTAEPEPEARLLGVRQWQSRHRHGEQLLEELDALLGEAGTRPTDLGGIVVGTGPGSFTGLRIGLATAKVLAYSLSVPLVGVSTPLCLALAAAAGSREPQTLAVTLPAGAADQYLAIYRVLGHDAEELSPASLVADPQALARATAGALLVCVDIEGPGVSDDAARRGGAAVAGLAQALATEGSRRLASGHSDDVAMLTPTYVALPRGVQRTAEEIRWSPDLR